MPLAACRECHKEISDQASACPACGFPIKKVEVVIEKTSKALKQKELLFAALSTVGLLMIVLQIPIGVLLVVVGILGYISVKFGEWWRHG